MRLPLINANRFSSSYLFSEINENEKTEEEHGTVDDSIEMLLKNFTEMNKLWVRIQYQGNTRQANQRRAERQEVRNLVGANLHRLSQLEGLTIEKYSNHVLPELLQQIVNCRDTLAQECFQSHSGGC